MHVGAALDARRVPRDRGDALRRDRRRRGSRRDHRCEDDRGALSPRAAASDDVHAQGGRVGRVQGVGFRDAMAGVALKAGVAAGFATVATAPSRRSCRARRGRRQVIDWSRRGPPAARVTSVEVTTLPHDRRSTASTSVRRLKRVRTSACSRKAREAARPRSRQRGASTRQRSATVRAAARTGSRRASPEPAVVLCESNSERCPVPVVDEQAAPQRAHRASCPRRSAGSFRRIEEHAGDVVARVVRTARRDQIAGFGGAQPEPGAAREGELA